jgi:hypothetical protein
MSENNDNQVTKSNTNLNIERNSVTNMARMFEIKALEGSRKSSSEKPNKEELGEDEAEVDDIFDDIIMPDSTRKKSANIMEKVDMFDKADPSSAQKIIENVSALGETQPYGKSCNKRWVEGGTFEVDDGTFTTRRRKSIPENLISNIK